MARVDWRACLAYSATVIPAAALGARTLLALPSSPSISRSPVSDRDVPVRHWLTRHQLKVRLLHLAVGGAIIGYPRHRGFDRPAQRPLFLFTVDNGAFLATEAQVRWGFSEQVGHLRTLRRADA